MDRRLQLNEWGRANRQATGSKRLALASLDAGDNDLKRFMRYLVTAIRQAYDDNTTIGPNCAGYAAIPTTSACPQIFTSSSAGWPLRRTHSFLCSTTII